MVDVEVESEFDFVVVDAVTLHYSIDGGFHFTARTMTPSGGGIYVAEIPGQVQGITVQYYIEAEGTNGERAVLPAGAPEEATFTFAVGEVEEIFSDHFDGLN